MFIPNSTGALALKRTRDINGTVTYGPSISCPFSPVTMLVGTQKTSVRADSSASRGSSDEIVAQRAKILVPAYVEIHLGDRFSYDGQSFEIKGVHARKSVLGRLDHYECDMEILP